MTDDIKVDDDILENEFDNNIHFEKKIKVKFYIIQILIENYLESPTIIIQY